MIRKWIREEDYPEKLSQWEDMLKEHNDLISHIASLIEKLEVAREALERIASMADEFAWSREDVAREALKRLEK